LEPLGRPIIAIILLVLMRMRREEFFGHGRGGLIDHFLGRDVSGWSLSAVPSSP
jgi:hypothetical protein